MFRDPLKIPTGRNRLPLPFAVRKEREMRLSSRTSVLVLSAVLLPCLLGCGESVAPRENEAPAGIAGALAPPTTQEPYVIIDTYPGWSSTGSVVMPPMFRLSWQAAPGTGVKRVRYLFHRVENPSGEYDPWFNMIEDLNANPWRYEDLWSRWYAYPAGNGMGSEVVIGDDEEVPINRQYVFAVQAIGPRKSMTTEFTRNVNARIFLISWGSRLMIDISEPRLGDFRIYADGVFHTVEIEPGTPVNFSWQGDPSYYGGEIAGYRYGWDITDPDDPSQWAVTVSIDNVSAPERIFWSGTHTLYVEATDTFGSTTMGEIRLMVVPGRRTLSKE